MSSLLWPHPIYDSADRWYKEEKGDAVHSKEPDLSVAVVGTQDLEKTTLLQVKTAW